VLANQTNYVAQKLQAQLPDATFIVGDAYGFNVDIQKNPAQFGKRLLFVPFFVLTAQFVKLGRFVLSGSGSLAQIFQHQTGPNVTRSVQELSGAYIKSYCTIRLT
jgi:hypothetical protein